MKNRRRTIWGWLVTIALVVAVGYILTYDPGDGAFGVTDIRGCNRIASDFVTLEGVYIFGAEKRFQLVRGDAINWYTLRSYAAQSPRAIVNPVIELYLQCNGIKSYCEGAPEAAISSASPKTIKYLINKLSGWEFSPYREGKICFCFDLSGNLLVVDTTCLTPSSVQDADNVPVEKVWSVQHLRDSRVVFGKVCGRCN